MNFRTAIYGFLAVIAALLPMILAASVFGLHASVKSLDDRPFAGILLTLSCLLPFATSILFMMWLDKDGYKRRDDNGKNKKATSTE